MLVIPLNSWNWGVSMEELAERAPESCKDSSSLRESKEMEHPSGKKLRKELRTKGVSVTG